MDPERRSQQPRISDFHVGGPPHHFSFLKCDGTGGQHPLLIQLESLQTSLTKFQHEAHTSSLKLQHHSLSTSRALDRVQVLEHENGVLNDELAVLRSVSSPSANFKSNGKESQVDQLTLSLRTLNEKISATESMLARRTHELAYTQAELTKQKLATDAAYELASRIRAREEGINELRRKMEWKWRVEEEKVRMCERTVGEYADLVRTLEGRGRGRSGSGAISGGGTSQISFFHDNATTTTSSKETIERL